ncbi:hypothetical protein SAMN06272771_0050 [Streptomyces sp. Ag82_O1-12]|uniref:hypothetical protein n=1 Tax=unclassified Streptomyces TaxID=2593676 RepID=UPI000BD3E140|nr:MULTISPECIES: hypothetical protein [unclassified Streptomyces]SMQ13780.1 hypothetical protein SAMN06272771_0050 [Streptomyces sp. Ag82_O1-12]SOD42811.1 hypothetical protein SAMN06272727_0039 [Streptomyces sp. Ag82_G6-1]
MRRTGTRQAQLNRLWGAACAFAGIFFFVWAVSFVKANVLNKGLRSRCEAFHETSFPFENSCIHGDGTVEGANGLILEGAFFGSMTAAAACLIVTFAIEATRRK